MRRPLIIVAIVLLFAASMPIVSNDLLRLVEGNTIRLQPDDVKEVDAIVVLSGMLTWVPSKDGLIQEWSDPDRFWAGVELIQANKAPVIIFTGGKLPWEDGQGNEGMYLKKYAQLFNVPEQKIIVTSDVVNTEQEAAAIHDLLKDKQNIILVTSAFHMRRAQFIFEKQGFSVFPYPVDFRVPGGPMNLMSFLPQAGAIGQTDLAIRELAGIAFYKFKGMFFADKHRDIIKK